MTSLLLLLAAMIFLVIALCAAVRFFRLDHVNLNASVLKLAVISFSVKGREEPVKARTRPPTRKKRR